ncbi:MAG: TrkA family potassium uptake protein, partial [Propionibacteriaceae bacterium]|nr:TrkA family potassium uptake protein [Propionibacteriaceae bacterium]
FKIENVVARIYDQGRAEIYERLGIPSVATVRWSADQVMRRLLPSGSEPQWRDPSGNVRLVEVQVDSEWVGTRLSAMERKANCKIPFVVRFGIGMIPNPETVFQDGDLVYIGVNDEQVPEVELLFGNPPV